MTIDATGKRMDTMAKRTLIVGAMVLVTLTVAGMALAEYCLGEGFMLGFNGISTFNRADNVRAVIAATPLEQTLLETDAPYLTPVPYRGRPNASFYLPFIAEQVATTMQLEVEDLLRQVYRNSKKLFFENA